MTNGDIEVVLYEYFSEIHTEKRFVGEEKVDRTVGSTMVVHIRAQVLFNEFIQRIYSHVRIVSGRVLFKPASRAV